jgi:hypothetical protein
MYRICMFRAQPRALRLWRWTRTSIEGYSVRSMAMVAGGMRVRIDYTK